MKSPVFSLFCTLLIAFASTCQCYAQNDVPIIPNAFSKPLTFSYISINEGLPSNNITSIIQDKHGWIWVGTDKGLAKYNGYRVAKIPCSTFTVVNSLAEKGDSLLVGTENGLYLYLQKHDSIAPFEISQKRIDLSSIQANDILIDDQGTAWISTYGNGIICIHDDKAEMVPTPDASYSKLAKDHEGNIWAVSAWAKKAIVKYDKKKKAFLPYEIDLAAQSPVHSLTLTCARDKHLWMACTDGRLVRINTHNHHAEVVLSHTLVNVPSPHIIFELEKGQFLIGSDNGLFKYNHATGEIVQQTRYTKSISPLSDNFVYSILRDKEGGLWIGTYFGGLNYTHPSKELFTYHWHTEDANSVQGNIINSFFEDSNHHIWITSDDAGVTLYIPQKQLFIPVPLTNEAGQQVCNTHGVQQYGNKVYVGTYGQGIFTIDINTLKTTHIPALRDKDGNFLENSAYSFCIDKDSCLWVGTHNSICTYNEESQSFERKRLTNSSIHNIVEDKSGNLWFATFTMGVTSFNGKKWKLYSKLNSKSNTPSTDSSIAIDSKGNVWVGVSDGLYIYDRTKDEFCPVDISDRETIIQGLTVNGDDLWISTNHGVLRMSIKERKVTQAIKRVDNTFLSAFIHNSLFKASSGEMYIGTNNGFVSFAPSKSKNNGNQCHIVFSDFEVMNKKVATGSRILPKSLAYTKEIHLKHSENVFRVYFSAMSFISPTDINYEYKLEGFDKQWASADNHTSISYTNLKPGSYTFLVRGRYDSDENSPVSSLKIVIEPPFYWCWYSQTFYAILVALALYELMRRMLKRKARKFEKQIKDIHSSAQKEIEHIQTSAQKEIEDIHSSVKKEIEDITIQKEKEIEDITIQKEKEIEDITIQKEKEIEVITTQKEKEVHDAYIKRMTITQKDQQFLSRLEDIIERNYSDSEFSIETLANELGISRTGLFTKLKTLADVTPNEMLQIIRLRHAADLLQQKQYLVSEVCYMVGFSNPSYFGKCFQRQYGVTPAKYGKG